MMESSPPSPLVVVMSSMLRHKIKVGLLFIFVLGAVALGTFFARPVYQSQGGLYVRIGREKRSARTPRRRSANDR